MRILANQVAVLHILSAFCGDKIELNIYCSVFARCEEKRFYRRLDENLAQSLLAHCSPVSAPFLASLAANNLLYCTSFFPGFPEHFPVPKVF